jgi:hypothetical protein
MIVAIVKRRIKTIYISRIKNSLAKCAPPLRLPPSHKLVFANRAIMHSVSATSARSAMLNLTNAAKDPALSPRLTAGTDVSLAISELLIQRMPALLFVAPPSRLVLL